MIFGTKLQLFKIGLENILALTLSSFLFWISSLGSIKIILLLQKNYLLYHWSNSSAIPQLKVFGTLFSFCNGGEGGGMHGFSSSLSGIRCHLSALGYHFCSNGIHLHCGSGSYFCSSHTNHYRSGFGCCLS